MSNQYLKQVDNIMKHEVSRADFVKYVGVALLSMVGVTSFLKNLNHNVRPTTTAMRSKQLAGYGDSPYGR